MNNELVIVPNKSVGNITFGESRETIRQLLGTEYKEFRKTKYSSNTTDDYGFYHIYYNKENCCEAVEFFEKTPLLLEGKDLFSMTYDDLKAYIQAMDNNVEINNDGITSKLLDISAYVVNNNIESIMIACDNYY